MNSAWVIPVFKPMFLFVLRTLSHILGLISILLHLCLFETTSICTLGAINIFSNLLIFFSVMSIFFYSFALWFRYFLIFQTLKLQLFPSPHSIHPLTCSTGKSWFFVLCWFRFKKTFSSHRKIFSVPAVIIIILIFKFKFLPLPLALLCWMFSLIFLSLGS